MVLMMVCGKCANFRASSFGYLPIHIIRLVSPGFINGQDWRMGYDNEV